MNADQLIYHIQKEHEGIILTDFAEKYGVARYTVANVARRLGVLFKSRYVNIADHHDKVVLLAKTSSCERMAKIIGVAKSSMFYYCKRNGIQWQTPYQPSSTKTSRASVSPPTPEDLTMNIIRRAGHIVYARNITKGKTIKLIGGYWMDGKIIKDYDELKKIARKVENAARERQRLLAGEAC